MSTYQLTQLAHYQKLSADIPVDVSFALMPLVSGTTWKNSDAVQVMVSPNGDGTFSLSIDWLKRSPGG